MTSIQWLDRPTLNNPIALIAFQGWGDAGNASTLAIEHLLDSFDSNVFALLDSDDFFDFQVARPQIELDDDQHRIIEWPDTVFHRIPLDTRDLVIVTGPEPHNRWKRFCQDLAEVLASVGVTDVVTLGAFVGQVPHTLPVPLIGVSEEPITSSTHGLPQSDYEGPSGILGVLNHYLAPRGFDVLGIWAAVPHYISAQEYPPAALALLEKTSDIFGIDVDLTDLKEAADEMTEEIDAAIDDPDMRDYVTRLETHALSEKIGIGPVDPDLLVDEIEKYLRND